ncbi:G protein-coupled glucose receptor regulating Gpa2-domain-containing protein [Colletotrichum acutatum]|uniref:G protein-coupled glucose receptor regulating Gpa2-domain-containing protein n=1 Tax=Glomerella acutata TaxID=27357 RepID=A0AAD8UEG9_GLOAC|nr:G protein-coupled glucose receptor regulating Gpa2-domain-containing protein [Colletotrichum acutatum]KAK1714589.1 G protein-coupled glucose receptor regulating Gpa2-domain-containing protein [Colletotrichum acutatum]
MAFDAAVASVTLTGSILSFLATTGVLISFALYHEHQRSFRHALVLNLTLAEFINSLGNTISGIIYIKNKELQPGAACVLNGMVGQLSVQASDFSILAIAVVTFLTITRKTYMPNASTFRKVMICLSVWVIPLITSTTATLMGTMKPVSGNWCWITRERPDLRYALTHGWRFGIIFTTILIYLYVWWYLGRHFRTMVSTSDPLYNSENSNGNVVTSSIRKKQGFESIHTPELEMDQFERANPTWGELPQFSPTQQAQQTSPVAPRSAPAALARRPSATEVDEDKEVQVQVGGRRPSAVRMAHFAEDKIDEEPTGEQEPGRKMSARISRFDDHDMDMSQASEARFSYLEQEDKLHKSASGGPSHLQKDMLPPAAIATQAQFAQYRMDSGPPRRPSVSIWKKTHRSRSSTLSALSFKMPGTREMQSRDFPTNPTLNHVDSRKSAPQNVTATMMSDFPIRTQTRKVEREIKRMMLLNAYPVMYVVLWIPGLVNRLMEASGNGSQSRVLAALQSSSQFIGLANAITYGFNQHVRHRIKGDFFTWLRRR